MEEVFKVYDSRIETFENNLDKLKNDLYEKDTLIVTLEEKLKYIEEKLKLYEDEIKELSEKIKICENNDKVKGLEEVQINLVEEAEKYRCNKCDFKTYYKRGLNIHKRKMNKVYSCADCKNIFDTIKDAKVHSYTHYYTIFLVLIVKIFLILKEMQKYTHTPTILLRLMMIKTNAIIVIFKINV